MILYIEVKNNGLGSAAVMQKKGLVKNGKFYFVH